MGKERQLLTLTELRKIAQKVKKEEETLVSGMGVIVDCSAAYRYQENRDFTQKLKIIDAPSGEEALVFLYSNKKEELVSSLKVGDVLFFHNFKIQIFNDNLQVKKAYRKDDSYFRIFSGNPGLSHYSPVDKKVGIDDEDGKLLTSLNQLRAFGKTYFKNHRVPLLFKNPKDKNQQTSSDFDMILRVIDCEVFPTHYKLQLSNEKDEFHLNFPRQIEPGVYKVRSIAEAKWEDRICHLTGNDYTFFLQISDWMKSYDPKEWDRLATESGKKKARRAKIQTKVTAAGKKAPKMTLKELFDKDQHKEEVRVNCEVMDVITTFRQGLKRFDKENNTEKGVESETGEYIYSIHLLLSDPSLEGEVCNAYVYTFDGRGLQFLPDLQPEGIYGRNLLDYEENYKTFVNRLVEESNYKDTPLQLVLSPLFNGKETIYRIVDTQLLF